MYSGKTVLLIAGGGTLGTKVAEELLRLGASVEILCPEEKTSDHEKLSFHQGMGTEEVLKELFAKKRYDGIVNFIHYKEAEEYKQIHPLLMTNTDHLIFLSSYRVYANEQHPITETAPRLSDVITDPHFHETEKYAVPKALCEDYLRGERAGENWTIVRPVISFSCRRFDLLMYSRDRVIQAAKDGEVLLLPEMVKDFTAGFDWSGNSGKLIANLLFKKAAVGECFSVYSGHGMTWGQVAELYNKLIGLQVRWCSEEEYLDFHTAVKEKEILTWAWYLDRRYNRDIDCSKILGVTGLDKTDFATIEEGLKAELRRLQ
ncbi:MAG: NAD-dependent epimerase/dehydratase family protein [Oscillospiraceae bacterium]|nr:NAD-dependent epimerase/dehydratase family protein [Oscillospiraceae bacterium]